MLNKTDTGIVNTSPGPGEHLFRKIQSDDPRRALRQPSRIATGTAAYLYYLATIELQVDMPQNFRRQIARLVLNNVIGLGPIVVGRGDFGLVRSEERRVGKE